MQSSANQRRARNFSPFAIAAIVGMFPESAFAIPSPDVVVSAFASAGQLLGILSLAFGGAFLKSRSTSAIRPRGASRAWLLACVVALILSVTCNVLQYTQSVDAEVERLRATLIRPSFEEGKKVGDINLKTLSFSDQLEHPAAISTDAFLEKWKRGEIQRDFQLIDIRNPEEVEMGRIGDVQAVPMPDLRKHKAKYAASGKPFFLLCESGNRSGEMCTDLLAEGYPCHFMIGGYEKWIAENRPVVDLVRAGSEIRDIMDYPNKKVLLTTEEVQRLMSERDILFVDTRYPGDFELSHFPGAVNVPLRPMPTDEMWEALEALPRKPVISPCYDKRSCFYSMVLGLRLHRLGFEYLGRYTVPWEYFVRPKEKDYVMSWKEASRGTIFGTICQPLMAFLAILDTFLGSLVAAILCSIAIMRLALFPASRKAERDKLLLKAKAAELEALRESAEGDPERVTRSVLAWYKRNRISPLVTFLGAMLQIFCFIWLFGALQRYVGQNDAAFLWEKAASARDGYGIFPLLIALLFYSCMSATSSGGAKKLLMFAGISILLYLLVLPLGIALNFFIAANLVAFAIQSRILSHLLRDRSEAESAPNLLAPSGRDAVIPLREAYRYEGVGNKARRLSLMMKEGLPVPDGFVITNAAFEKDGVVISDQHAGRVRALLQNLGKGAVAVRSSGIKEDGAQQSFAGIFDSVINVHADGLNDAVKVVRESMSSDRVRAYAGEAALGGAVLVQKMMNGGFSGVYFTEHPGCSGAALIELTAGACKPLVNGLATGSAYTFGRVTNRPLDREEPPIPLAPLLSLGARIEKLFGQPQDIEWAHENGRFYLLQARDITKLSRTTAVGSGDHALIERERHRLLTLLNGAPQEGPCLSQNELSELLPRPTPMSLSIMEELWKQDGSADLAAALLGLPYQVDSSSPPLFLSVFGQLFMNATEARARAGKPAGMRVAYRLSRLASAIEEETRERVLPSLSKEMAIRQALSFESMKNEDLAVFLSDWRARFVKRVYLEAEKINLLADFYMKMAQRDLKRAGLPPASYLSEVPDNAASRMYRSLSRIRDGAVTVKQFLEEFGHRAPHDYELSQPRYSDSLDKVEEMAVLMASAAKPASRELEPLESKLLKQSVERARSFQALKEDAKHEAMREMALLRRALCEAGKRTGLHDLIFYLRFDEVLELVDGSTGPMHELAERRLAESEAFRSIELPAAAALGDLEIAGTKFGSAMARSDHSGELAGTLVAGSEEVCGTVRVISRVEELETFVDGEILVSRFTDPHWTAVFRRASGVITEVGGWLSHAAILARECNITTIVGANHALRRLKCGDRVRLCLDGRIELLEARDAPREEAVQERSL